jgi:AAA15 family ATPase/GTPase
MEIALKNIGMIKEANVKLDGLTVIAGENDTGKSTVGKALFMLLYHMTHTLSVFKMKKEIGDTPLTPDILKKYNLWQQSLETIRLCELIFDNQITDAEINLKYANSNLAFRINKHHSIFASEENGFVFDLKDKRYFPIFIETPLVWNFDKFFRQMSTIESYLTSVGKSSKIGYPFLLKDLSFNLSIEQEVDFYNLDIKDAITSIIGGEFKKDNEGNFYFERENKRISLLNTATGIKAFGILQVLLENNYLNENTILILDEPEVHLHPNWQLKMAKTIVDLVKNGVIVLVNSHSPYMIEALQRYSELEGLGDKTNFYLAEDGVIEDKNRLQEIFEKLSEPFDMFDKMDSDILNGK